MPVRDAGVVITRDGDVRRADAGGDLTVGQTADLVGVSVRTLHHWDAIGLVRPSGRTAADYRLYGTADVARIHRVLVYRELGLALADIAALLDDPGADEVAHLRRQRQALLGRISRLQEMVSAVDEIVKEREMGNDPTPATRAELFGNEWAAEAEERWGDTEQWKQSQERQASMTASDQERIIAEGDALNAELGQAKRDGVAPGSDAANALAERHRAMIAHAYDCTHAMQVCLGRMYVADPRFTEYYEKIEPGLAQWLTATIDDNARANGVDPETAGWE